MHSKDWYPYQYRFKTSSFSNYFNVCFNKVNGSEYCGTPYQMKIGSIVYNAKTLIEGLIGTEIGFLTDYYFGDYLRFIG